jgi:SAM-dependent methyltransferase
VEFADAVPSDSASDATCKASLDRMYGTLDEGVNARYVDFMDRVERVVGAAPGRLHDVGCGNGQLLYEARRRGWHVQGNDLVGGVGSDLERHGITFYRGSLAQLSLSLRSCDLMTSFCVLPHHLLEPGPEMQAAYAMLKPGGWLVLQLPDNGTLRIAGKALYALLAEFRPRPARWILANLYGPGGHQYAFNRTNITEYLKKIGFGQILVESYYPAVGPTLARFQSA